MVGSTAHPCTHGSQAVLGVSEKSALSPSSCSSMPAAQNPMIHSG